MARLLIVTATPKMPNGLPHAHTKFFAGGAGGASSPRLSRKGS